MTLFLCAQDLRSIWIGLLKDQTFVVLEELPVPPEGYLLALDRFLKVHQQPLETVQGLCVVTGPGSFTASRVSLTIVNTLHFVYRLPLFVLTNPDRQHPERLVAEYGLGQALGVDVYAEASYDRPPHLTTPRGDNRLEH